MKILIVRNAYDKDCGGAEQYALNLCIALFDSGNDVLLMTQVPNLIEKSKKNRIPYKKGLWNRSQKWSKFYFIRFPVTVLWYIYFIVRYKVDVVHPQGRDDFIFATIAAAIVRKPVVWTDHGDLKYCLNLSIHPFPYLRSWILFAARWTDSIICVSEKERQKIVKTSPNWFHHKLKVINNGVFTPQNLQPIIHHKPYIITNSRLVKDKGIEEIIQAFALLNRDDIELWFIGGYSGNLKFYQNLSLQLGVSSYTKFLGYVERPNDYVSSSLFFVHASYHEAFSLAVIEAAMLGKPIIATDVGGTSEIIINKKSGILIKPMDILTLSKNMQYLIDNPQDAKILGKNAAEIARLSFDFTKIVVEKVIPLYKS